MKRIFIIGILSLYTTLSFAQENNGTKKPEAKMKKSDMLGLRTTIYKVGNITKAKKWYSEAFGIEPYFDQSFYVGFNVGGFELGLQPEKKPTKDKVESVVTYWGVNDINKTYEKLIELGATENEKPYNVGGEIMTATVKDPFGNVIGLIFNPEFKVEK
ncbi:VOC family protein [Tenacibaculum xiamenense]|uniref:VOC family protein n=1 Tax=Tenacibaculum xiamenense TaxID=1261553 RepID=UPI0038960B6B